VSPALAEQLALLPDYLSRHLLLSITALVIGVSLSLPLAILALRVKALQGPVLGVASAIQTVPSLALLALMVPLLGVIGFLPAAIALVLYSMLPVIRNTVTGIQEVDPNLIEAGRGLGMTESQLLRRVQLPLATPVIIAGIRTATVWVVGITTLSTPVGATSLGNYIFSGLQTQNHTAVVVGCVAAAGLALLLDGLIRLLETAAARRSRPLGVTALLVTLLVIGAGLSPLLVAGSGGGSGPRAVLGAKTFTEQYVLTRLMADRLEAVGIETRVLDSLGSTVVFDALVNGRIDAYVDYTGTVWANHMGREDNPGADTVLAELKGWLAREHEIESVFRLGFENAYAMGMTRERAEALGVRSIGDLARHAPDLVIGGDYEFFGRPEWRELQARYGLAFAREVTMDSTLMYAAVDSGEVDVITAFSTDGRIPAFDLVLLDDPREAIPPYDAVLLLAPGTAERRPDLARALAALTDGISDDAMRSANRRVDVDGGTVAEAAAELDAAIGGTD
jgi:osmoprotectant transport system permease protein